MVKSKQAVKAKSKRPMPEATPEMLAVREQHKEWAATMRSSRSASKRRTAANGIYKAFYNPLIFYFMRKIGTTANPKELEDLTMSTLEKAFGKIDKYCPDTSAFSTWIYAIALNTLIDSKRKGKEVDIVSVEAINAHNVATMGEADAELFELVSDERDPFEVTQRSEVHSLVHEAIAGLSNRSERKVIELRFLKEYSYEEIAEALEMPMGTVKALIFRAKDHLQETLSGKLEMS